jgi:glycosyltransferase involved in cell wall biosynthesis
VKILIAHNRYRSSGGEDEVFYREGELLRSAGHHVVEYVRHNAEISEHHVLSGLRTGLRTVWAWDSAHDLRIIARRERPDVVHFHNTFPLISPAAYYACQREGIPVVQSLHNARLICPAAMLSRGGGVCEDCLGKTVPWPGIVHACYHNSHSQTAVVAGMLAFHRLLGTWQKEVDAYIVFTEFFRQKCIAAGLPRDKIFAKPHFVSADPGAKEAAGDYALFLGRLAPEKGVPLLLKAWRNLSHIPLRIRGEGPLEKDVNQFQHSSALIDILPRLSRKECFDLIKGARFLVWPSAGYYETFGLVVIEAFACGTPVITSSSGAMKELVEDGRTGLHFEPGNAESLAAKVEWAWTHPREMQAMGSAGRAEYLRKYTAANNYEMLMRIYRSAIQTSQLSRLIRPPAIGHRRSPVVDSDVNPRQSATV